MEDKVKELKDCLHLYLGCECMIEFFSGPSDNPKKLTSLVLHEFENNGNNFGYNIKEVKPLLRRLDSMTEEEAADIYTIERDSVLHPDTIGFDVRRGEGCWKIVRLDLLDTTLIISDDGVVFKVTEDRGKPMIEYTRNMPLIVHYLLSKGFDLFNLIDEKLAIDINQ